MKKVGVVLKYDFLVKYGISGNELALAIGVHPNRISEIVRGIRGVTIDTDLRLCRYFGMKKGYFFRLQEEYERELCEEKISKDLAQIVPCLKK